jgi:hypothetical protein
MPLVLGEGTVDAKAAMRELGEAKESRMRTSLIAAGMILIWGGIDRLSAGPASEPPVQAAGPGATTAFAQATNPRRPPPRIVITPRPPAASIYPSPYPYADPGPGHARACTSWLEPEARPSGTVIVPRMRCWWVRS